MSKMLPFRHKINILKIVNVSTSYWTVSFSHADFGICVFCASSASHWGQRVSTLDSAGLGSWGTGSSYPSLHPPFKTGAWEALGIWRWTSELIIFYDDNSNPSLLVSVLCKSVCEFVLQMLSTVLYSGSSIVSILQMENLRLSEAQLAHGHIVRWSHRINVGKVVAPGPGQEECVNGEKPCILMVGELSIPTCKEEIFGPTLPAFKWQHEDHHRWGQVCVRL